MDSSTIDIAIRRGFYSAFSRFEDWTNGCWLSEYGCENVIQVHVAEKLCKARTNPKYSICLEVNFSEILEKSGAHGKGKIPNEINSGKRADITIFNAWDKPKTIIEVKRQWVTSNCIEDLNRIAALIRYAGKFKNGSVREGYLAFYLYTEGKSREIKDKIREKERIIETQWKNRFDLKWETISRVWSKSAYFVGYTHAVVVVRVHS